MESDEKKRPRNALSPRKFHVIPHLVGGIPTPLTNVKVNWDDELPNSDGKIIQSCSRKTTNQPFIDGHITSLTFGQDPRGCHCCKTLGTSRLSHRSSGISKRPHHQVVQPTRKQPTEHQWAQQKWAQYIGNTYNTYMVNG